MHKGSTILDNQTVLVTDREKKPSESPNNFSIKSATITRSARTNLDHPGKFLFSRSPLVVSHNQKLKTYLDLVLLTAEGFLHYNKIASSLHGLAFSLF